MYYIFSIVINDDCIAVDLIFLTYDHHAQFLIIPNYTITQNSKKDVYRQNFRHFSFKKIITYLGTVIWDNTINVLKGNVNNSFQNISIKL